MRAVGDQHHRTRLPDAIVREIRDLRERGETYDAILLLLAQRGHVVSYSLVKKICLYERRVGDLVHEQE